MPPWQAWALLLLGIAGFAGLWITFAFYTERQHTWMAVLGALDMALMLRLGGWPRGPGRALVAATATAIVILLANWGITAAHLGRELGMQPWASAMKLGSHHAWTLAQLVNGFGDLLWIVIALLAAAVASR